MIYVAYVRQKEALGLGHAVLMARELVGNEPFAVLLADDVIDNPVPALKQMVDVFNQKQCSVVAAQVVEGEMISSYGVLDARYPKDSTVAFSRFATWWKNQNRKKPLRTSP
jgi:UTP--glucose-1-phosphate uridylyltransferase